MQVIPTDDYSTLHLQLLNDSGENAPSDGDITGEGAFLVNISTLDRLKSEKNIVNNCTRFDEM